ncbi:MAG: bifunctional phosphoribosylaminoimidazolecarboxamide formyltransferase/IMP cyclohydrolase [Bifidobacteriaceae bacterium]|jgi:phosphoribosylaminoimidazolecarboxamide formyltransferase/IMP cyclohydrolase|nr:bifunctional phosphoribosylaminoimidazolecarboxamide formyltransferase/IMP cyclohydrolase [Bifidobacteriaceae bacterium]
MADATRRPIHRAIVSVYDKTGLTELAQALAGAGVEIVSTGSTAKTIAAAGVPVTEVSQLTGFPECLEGRVKTLHPRVHAGILADLRKLDHVAQLESLEVEPFELVVVNLYPFAATVASGAGVDECVEQIDIGGPTMVRAAAKNHPSVAVVTSPARYGEVIEALAAGGFTLEQRQALARDAFIHTADYDVAVATWMTSTLAPEPGAAVPAWWGGTYRRLDTLRYGENPHQAAAVFAQVSGSAAVPDGAAGLALAEQLGGKAMSYNNYQDADAAWRAALDFADPAVAIIKHANPCGIAVGATIEEAHRKAHECDSLSAFGGVIAANRTVTLAMAQQVKPVFTEVIVAPDYEPAALELLQTKKDLRILRLPAAALPAREFRAVSGGLLVQERDRFQAAGDDPAAWTLVAGAPADAATLADLAFAWKACRAVKSNAILLAKGGASVGVGMGQVNRVDSAHLAVDRAGAERAAGAVAASDAFFPFPDGLEVLLAAGVKAVVEPGGSIRDEQVIAAAKAAGVTLYFTGSRHFFH